MSTVTIIVKNANETITYEYSNVKTFDARKVWDCMTFTQTEPRAPLEGSEEILTKCRDIGPAVEGEEKFFVTVSGQCRNRIQAIKIIREVMGDTDITPLKQAIDIVDLSTFHPVELPKPVTEQEIRLLRTVFSNCYKNDAAGFGVSSR